MKRFLLASSAMLLCTLSVSLFAPSSASAASDYDNAVNLISPLIIQETGGSSSRDYSLDWFLEARSATDIACDFSNTSACSLLPLLDLYVGNSDPLYNWAVVQLDGAQSYNIIFSGDPLADMTFYNGGLGYTGVFINGDLYYTVGFTYSPNDPYATDNGTTLNISPSYYQQSEPVLVSAEWQSSLKIFLSTFPVVYPPGYDGSQIPETHTPVDTTPPEFQFTYSVDDKQITLYDLSNLSLDQSDCYFQINPNGTQVNTELHYDCDTQNSVTHTVDEYGLYDVTLMYVTPDGLKSSIILTLDIDGSSFSDTYGYAVNDIFYKCISSELPFINFTECYNNVLIFANMLAFDRLHFGTDFTPPEGCRNLVVLGDWIGASTNTVCPMIPSYVRDVTTPFVTFLLGLLMLKFITSRAGGGFS